MFAELILKMLVNRHMKYPTLIKHAWFAMAVLLLVFCGPVKRLIEYKLSNESPVTFLQNVDKQLRTGVRERKDISPLITVSAAHTPDTNLDFIIIAASFALLLLRYIGVPNTRSFYSEVAVADNFPRYLLLRQLRV